MTEKLYANQGNAYFPVDKSTFQNTLPVGTYSINYDQQKGFFFTRVDDMAVPARYYGNVDARAERIRETFAARDGQTTGILLTGLKGTGKTMLTKKISQDLRNAGVSTFIVTEPHHGDAFNKLVQELGKCMIIFDEFEKIYQRREYQESMLTLLDGTFNSHKLVAITVNDAWGLNDALQNRPGRILYSIEYGALEREIIEEYCGIHLKDKSQLDDIVKASVLISDFTMDMLIALVTEMNRWGETVFEALKWLNIRPPSSISYSVESVVHNGVTYTGDLVRYNNSGNPLMADEDEEFYINLLERTKSGGLQPKDHLCFDRGDIKSYTGENIFIELGATKITMKRKTKTFNYDWRAA
jgi:hypothetical protein